MSDAVSQMMDLIDKQSRLIKEQSEVIERLLSDLHLLLRGRDEENVSVHEETGIHG